MKTKSQIELTPLLDIILILLFAFLINTQGAHANETEKLKEEIENIEMGKLNEISLLNNKINELGNINNENNTLNEKITILEEKLLWEQDQRSEQTKDLEEAIKVVSNMLSLYENEWRTAANSKVDAAEALKKIADEENAILRLYQFQMLMNRFYILDIELIGVENEIIVNREKTDIYITREEANTKDLREKKVDEIYDLLEETLLKREGGDEMVLLTLIVRDSDVYQYAYNLMTDTIRSFKYRQTDMKIYTYEFTSYIGGD